MTDKMNLKAANARPSPPSITGEPGKGDIARATGGVGDRASSPARDNSLLPERMTLLSSGESRKVNESLRLDADFEGAGGLVAQTPDTAAPAGGHIGDGNKMAELDNHAAAVSIAAMVEEWYDGGRWTDHLLFHLIERRLNRFRALPAAASLRAEVERLRKSREDDGIQIMQLNARIAELEAERDFWRGAVASANAERDAAQSAAKEAEQIPSLLSVIDRLEAERPALIAAAYKDAADYCWSKRDLLADAEKQQVAAGLTGRDYYGRRLEAELLSRAIRALTPTDALDALEQAKAGAQCCMCGKKGLSTAEDGGPECELSDGRWTCSSECWEKASDLTGAVKVKPLDLRRAVQDGYDTWAAKPHNTKWVRRIDGTPIPNDLIVCIQGAVVAALSQPAQGGEGGAV